ncbi:MAG: 6-aminohexanoate hydrolase [Frankiales bacterium]|nr:6-aminohexanoate hydrolase [Frankiales bacterium]
MISPDPAPRLVPYARTAVDGPTAERGNESFTLRPVTGSVEAGTLEYDFDGVLIGTAEYPQGPTGVTAIGLPGPARTAVDRHGVLAGVTELPFSEGICLAGGSTLGLAAGTGVAEELRRRSADGSAGGAARSGGAGARAVASSPSSPARPSVNIAVLDDFGARDNAVHPDVDLGQAALRAAQPGRARYGRVGAGTSACVGKLNPGRAEFAGQGVAFREVGPVKFLVVAVLNSLGVILDRQGRVVRGNYAATGGRRHPVADYAQALFNGTLSTLSERPGADPVPSAALGNGSAANGALTVVITNARLSDRELAQFGRQVHASMARAIQPFHTDSDGDVLFAVTTDAISVPRSPSGRGTGASLPTALAAVASEAVWDAVLRSVL